MAIKNPESVVILGATSGVARYIAHEFARLGSTLVLAGRNTTEIEILAADIHVRYRTPCHILAFDAAAYDDHDAFVSNCSEALGGPPDGVVLCFGYMPDQTRAQTEFAQTRQTIEVNFSGAVSILERFAAVFESRGSGFIAALSSVAGDRGRKMNYLYGASKAGLSAYLQGLRNRLHPAGVQVTTIKPGFMDTPMTMGMKLPRPLVAAPDKAAKAMTHAILKGRDVAYVPFFWRYIMWIIKSIPEWQFKKMSI